MCLFLRLWRLQLRRHLGPGLYTHLVPEKLRPNKFPRPVGSVPEQFVAFLHEWVKLTRFDTGRNIGFSRLVARRSGRG